MVCLLCGELLCLMQDCCSDRPGMKSNEGELTYHTRTCEGEQSIFINTRFGEVYLIEGKRSGEKPCPYVNKFGENYSVKAKKWDHFYMDDAHGGLQIYNDYKQYFLDFTIGNQIIQERSTR